MSSRDALNEGPVQEASYWGSVAPELVLALEEIHPGLCSHAGINVGEEGGWDANVRRASPVEGCGQSHDVQADAASDGDDGLRSPVDAEVLHFLQDVQDQVHGFRFFGGRQGEDFVLNVILFKVLPDFGAVKFINDFVYDNEAPQPLFATSGYLELLGVSDVTPEESGVRGIQNIECFYHFVAKIDGSFDCPGNPTLGDTFTSGRDRKTWFVIIILLFCTLHIWTCSPPPATSLNAWGLCLCAAKVQGCQLLGEKPTG